LNSQVCVDASLVLKLILVEADSVLAHQLWSTWIDTGVEVVAPPLFAFEGTSVLCSKVYRGLISPEEADLMFTALHLLGVRLLYPEGLHQRAWELARRFNRPQAYDSHYLALAEMLGLEFWTADERLYNAVKDAFPWVKWLGDAPRG
jgi:predicted nucleic acid-binding protein